MTSTYISGYDGSTASRAALAFTTRLAERTRAEVVAANVFTQTPAILRKGASDGALAELREDARRDAERVFDDGAVPEVSHVAVGASSIAEGLHRLAEDQHATLIAVGATHRGALGRLVVGSVGERLLHGAPCPVAVVPDAPDGGVIATVGIAYDGRDESRAALRAATDLARALGARLVVLAVYEPMLTSYAAPGFPASTVDLDRRLEAEFAEQVRQAVDVIPGVEVEVRSFTGFAASTLADAAHDSIDLLVTGSRGYGAVRGVLIGSVSRHLVDHAPCPVLVVPRGVSPDAFAGRPRAQEVGA